ncbi:MAG: hypothetical protein R3Y54_06540 [Eubacteriales bacterium]
MERKVKNILYCWGGMSEYGLLDYDMIPKINKALSIKNSYVILMNSKNKNRHIFEKESTCILREDLIFGRVEQYEKILYDGMLSMDDDILIKIQPYLLQIIKIQQKFEVFPEFRVDSTLESHYSIMIKNLLFLNAFLEQCEIEQVILTNIPHDGYDNLIYHLCKIKNISIGIFWKSTIPNRKRIVTEYTELEMILEREYEQLKKEYQENVMDAIILEDEIDSYFNNMLNIQQKSIKQYEMHADFDIMFERRYGKQYAKEYKDSVKLHQCYNIMAHMPMIHENYIYYAMQYTPELTSAPLGGGLYMDQTIPIRILAKSLPKGWRLYVKIHPTQLTGTCSIQLFEDISKIENVMLVKEECTSYDLISNSKATATLTGTVAWEAQFLNIPVIVFGYSEKNVAPLSYKVRTVKECKHAIESILRGDKQTNEKELKIFTKAMENISFPDNKAEMVQQIIDFCMK